MSEQIALASLFLSGQLTVNQLQRVRLGLELKGWSWQKIINRPQLLRRSFFWSGPGYRDQCPSEVEQKMAGLSEACERASQQLVGQPGCLGVVGPEPIRLLTYLDPDYPALLAQMDDPPLVLTVASKNLASACAKLSLPLIAMVGTRRMTGYGQYVARTLATELVGQRLGVVSGFMYGIDQAAQQATVQAGGLTVSVLGHGLNCVPARDYDLYNQFWQAGAIFVSEFPPGQEASKWTFVIRNRIIAGLSLATIVVEAAARSGSLITAQRALKYDREVAAVPGQITSPFSLGTQDLVNQGATLINNTERLVKDLRESGRLVSLGSPAGSFGSDSESAPAAAASPASALARSKTNSSIEEAIIDQLKATSQSTDQLANSLQIDVSSLLATLTDLELASLITQRQNQWMIQ